MAEFEEKLNAILSDSEAMGQIVSIAQALAGSAGAAQPASAPPGAEAEAASPPQDAPVPAQAQESGAAQPDWSALMGLLGGLGGGGSANPLGALGDLDPRLIQAAVRLFSEYSAADDRKVALLGALKPFLKPERSAKVDKAVQIAKLSRVIRVAFQLFKKDAEGDAEHV